MRNLSLILTGLLFFLIQPTQYAKIPKKNLFCAGLAAIAIDQGWHITFPKKVASRWKEKTPKNLVQFKKIKSVEKNQNLIQPIDLNISIHGTSAFLPPIVNPLSYSKHGFCFWNGKSKPHKVHKTITLFTQEDFLKKIEIGENINLMFCWNGQLAHSYRVEAARQLYKELRGLENFLFNNGYEVHFNIETHSHGGNVGLMLALAHDETTEKLKNKIRCLSNFGTPVNEKTEHLATHPLFEKFQHFYFAKDLFQIADVCNRKLKPSRRVFLESVLKQGSNCKQFLVKDPESTLDHFALFYLLKNELLEKSKKFSNKQSTSFEIEIDSKKYSKYLAQVENKKKTILGLIISAFKSRYKWLCNKFNSQT